MPDDRSLKDMALDLRDNSRDLRARGRSQYTTVQGAGPSTQCNKQTSEEGCCFERSKINRVARTRKESRREEEKIEQVDREAVQDEDEVNGEHAQDLEASAEAGRMSKIASMSSMTATSVCPSRW